MPVPPRCMIAEATARSAKLIFNKPSKRNATSSVVGGLIPRIWTVRDKTPPSAVVV